MKRAGAAATERKPAPGPGYGTGARIFHWLVALLVVVQIPAGIGMTSEPLIGIADPLYILHKGSGSVLLVLVLARIAWRITHAPPPFEDWMRPGEKRTAAAAHAAIYALLLVMAVSGYVRTAGDGFPIEFLDALGIPPLIPFMPRAARVMLVVHQFAVIALIILVSAHVSQVLRHQLIERNPVLARMWPPFGGGGRVRAEAPGAGEDG